MLTLLLSRYARSAAKIHPTPASASWNLRTLSWLTNLSAKQSGTLQELLFPYHRISVPQSSKLVCSPLGKCIGVITGVMLTHMITSVGVHTLVNIVSVKISFFFRPLRWSLNVGHGLDHDILWRKIQQCCITGASNRWFDSHLKGRTQSCLVNDCSHPKPLLRVVRCKLVSEALCFFRMYHWPSKVLILFTAKTSRRQIFLLPAPI